MGLSELAQLFERNPLTALVAVLCVTVAFLFGLLVRSWIKRIEAAQLYGADLAKMLVLKERTLELHSQTLELHKRTLAVLRDPRFLRLFQAAGTKPPGRGQG